MERKYPNEWLFIIEPKISENTELLATNWEHGTRVSVLFSLKFPFMRDLTHFAKNCNAFSYRSACQASLIFLNCLDPVGKLEYHGVLNIQDKYKRIAANYVRVIYNDCMKALESKSEGLLSEVLGV